MTMSRLAIISALVATIGLDAAAGAADAKREPPYYASIAPGRARTRTGPARAYPASWLYQRADLPVKVVAVYKEWRRIEDPDGAQGWMLGNMVSSTRTAIVRGGEPVEMRDAPGGSGKLLWRAAPGVVGRISRCEAGWCRFDVKGQAGFVAVEGLWGVEPGERVP
jgi:SH3-like domain-containing protein